MQITKNEYLKQFREKNPKYASFPDEMILKKAKEKRPELEFIEEKSTLENIGDGLNAFGSTVDNIVGDTLKNVARGVDNATTDLTNYTMGTKQKPLRDRLGIEKVDDYQGGIVKRIGDRVGDVWDISQDSFDKATDPHTSFKESMDNKVKGTLQTAGGVLKAGFDTVGDVMMSGLSTVTTDETKGKLKNFIAKKYEEDKNVAYAINLAQGFAEEMEKLKKTDYDAWKSANASLGFAEGIVSIATAGVGVAAKNGVKTVTQTGNKLLQNQIKKVGTTKIIDKLKKVQASIGNNIKKQVEKVDKGIVKVKENGIINTVDDVINPKKDLDGTLKEVFQAQDSDVSRLKTALKYVDTDGVSSYQQFTKNINDSITKLAHQQDGLLDKASTTKLSLDDLSTSTSDGSYSINYVKKAIDDLKRYAENRSDIDILEKLPQFEKGEYTLKDLNDLARFYGQNFSQKAFKTNGDLKIGDIAGNYENTRSGLKNLVREQFGTDELKNLDTQMSSLYTAKNFTSKIETKVQNLMNKVHDRSIGEVLSNKIEELTNMMTLGFYGGLKKKFFQSGVGKKSMDSLDIQEVLGKNLARISKLIEKEKGMTDQELLKAVNSMVKQVKKESYMKNKVSSYIDQYTEKFGAKANFMSEKEVSEYVTKLEKIARDNNINIKVSKGTNEGTKILKTTSAINRSIPKNTGKKSIQARTLYNVKYESVEKMVQGINNGTIKGSYKLGIDKINGGLLGTVMVRIGNTSKRLHIPLQLKRKLQKMYKKKR